MIRYIYWGWNNFREQLKISNASSMIWTVLIKNQLNKIILMNYNQVILFSKYCSNITF